MFLRSRSDFLIPFHNSALAGSPTFGHHLLIAHELAIFVSGPQQDGEEVITLCRGVTPLVNEASKAIAQDMYGIAGATMVWQRPTVW